MERATHIGSNSYEISRSIRKRMPCPVHNNMPTRVTKASFVQMCLRHQEQSKIPAAVKAVPGRSHCPYCKTGEQIGLGKKWFKPDCVVWLDEAVSLPN